MKLSSHLIVLFRCHGNWRVVLDPGGLHVRPDRPLASSTTGQQWGIPDCAPGDGGVQLYRRWRRRSRAPQPSAAPRLLQQGTINGL